MADDLLEQLEQGKGNTKPSPRCRNWVFTLNNFDDEQINSILSFCSKDCEYLFSVEHGAGGTPHLQGFAFFKHMKSFEQCRSACNKAHWERAKGKLYHNIEYCTKEGGQVWTNMIIKKKLGWDSKPRTVALRGWQLDAADLILQRPDDRVVWWFWDVVGGTGKTTFCRWAEENYEDVVYVGGKGNDMKYAVMKFIEKNKRSPKVLLLDIPRGFENSVSYDGIESFKNGIFFNVKYESGQVNMDLCHVLCFANHEPDYSMLSKDRWRVRCLN